MVEPLRRYFFYDRRDPPADEREDMYPEWCKKCVPADNICNSTKEFRWPSPEHHRCLPETEWPPHAAQEITDAVLNNGWSMVGRGVTPQDLIAASYRLQELDSIGEPYVGVHAIAVAPDGQFYLINCRRERTFIEPLFPQSAFETPDASLAKAPARVEHKAYSSPAVPRPDALQGTGPANILPSASHMNRHVNHNPKGQEDWRDWPLPNPKAKPKAKSRSGNASWFDPKHAAQGPPPKAKAKYSGVASKAKARTATVQYSFKSVIEQQQELRAKAKQNGTESKAKARAAATRLRVEPAPPDAVH